MDDRMKRAIARIEMELKTADEEVENDPDPSYSEGYAEGLRDALGMLKEFAEGVR